MSYCRCCGCTKKDGQCPVGCTNNPELCPDCKGCTNCCECDDDDFYDESLDDYDDL